MININTVSHYTTLPLAYTFVEQREMKLDLTYDQLLIVTVISMRILYTKVSLKYK